MNRKIVIHHAPNPSIAPLSSYQIKLFAIPITVDERLQPVGKLDKEEKGYLTSITLDTIELCSAGKHIKNNYSLIILNDKNNTALLVRITLCRLMNLFPAEYFIRSHHAYIVPKLNVQYILFPYKIFLYSKIKIPIGFHYTDSIKKEFHIVGDGKYAIQEEEE